MRKALYLIPYLFDEADGAWPIKYVNDLACGAGAVAIRERDDGTPIEGEIVVEAQEPVHAALRAYADVVLIRDPF